MACGPKMPKMPAENETAQTPEGLIGTGLARARRPAAESLRSMPMASRGPRPCSSAAASAEQIEMKDEGLLAS